ncbi:MAG: preprotein translocase subunit SecY [Christensenellales bacterium]|jgi:preprotein translocase subunit SecY
MLTTLRNAWRVPEIRKKILYTLMILFLYRLGGYVPVPGLNIAYLQSQVGNYDLLGLLNLMSGGQLGDFTIFALGVGPYITSSIIMQLLSVAIPALERLSKEGGEEGRKKIQKITRYVTIGLAMLESMGIILSLGSVSNVLISVGLPHWLQFFIIGVTLTAGSCLVMWMGERITEKGIGNGISLIIFTGIASSLPMAIGRYGQLLAADAISFWIVPMIVVGILLMIVGITFVDMGQRRVPVQYAKRVVGRKMYGGQSTHIPLRINNAGVLPLIFAMSLSSFPHLIMQAFFPSSSFFAWYQRYLGTGTWAYMIIYAMLIVFFAYFSNSMSFDPVEMSKNMQQYGGFVPGIRPGRPTADYIRKISNRLTLFGAIFLMAVAIVPTAFTATTGMQSMFGPTSILILVSVALETSKQLEAQLLARHYRGFLK